MCIIATIEKYAYILGKMSAAPYTISYYPMCIRVYQYECVLGYCYIYTHMLPVLAYFYYSYFRLLPIMFFNGSYLQHNPYYLCTQYMCVTNTYFGHI